MDFGVRSAPTCVLRFWIGGEVAAMCRSGIGWTWLTGTKRCDRTWPSGTKRCELAVVVEAGSWYHYTPPDGRLYLSLSLFELGGPRAGRRIVLSHASDEGRFAGGGAAGCEYSEVFFQDR